MTNETGSRRHPTAHYRSDAIHTETYALLDPWASTTPWPWDPDDHSHTPMVGDPCAVEDCCAYLMDREVCYRVTEQDGWVCWRHVCPDEGPIVVPQGSPLYLTGEETDD